MKVVLFDHQVTGHRIEYARYIIKKLSKKGDDLVYVNWKPRGREQELRELDASLSYVVGENGNPLGENWLIRNINIARSYRYLSKKSNEDDVDVTHLLFLDECEFILFLVLSTRMEFGSRVYATIFNPKYDQRSNSLHVRFGRKVNGLSLRVMIDMKLIDGLFVHSERIKQKIANNIYIDNDDLINVIPDPIDPPTLHTKCDARERLELPKNQTILLFFGGMRWEKGPGLLLKAISQLDCEKASVVFAGPSDAIDEADVKDVSNNRNGVEIIPRFKFIPDDEIDLYFSAADAVCLPYRGVYAGTSGILQRAIASENTVIATDVGEVGPTVKKGDYGIVAKPDSIRALKKAIRKYLSNKKDYNEMLAGKSSEYIESHHWERMAEEVRSAYRL